MKYVSTRGNAPELGFCDAILAGLANDGGLYVPKIWPTLSDEEIAALSGKSYADIAFAVMWPYVEGDIPKDIFQTMINEAYATFRHDAVAPLVQTGSNEFVLELFHGPTLAFKDVAMQLLARVMDFVLDQRGARATIIGATSGDTGGAAIEAFRGRANTDIFIMFPHGKVSPVQQRQMTSVLDDNVHCIALEGNFDDCQGLLKDMFAHESFRDTVAMSGVNSINWGRIMAQVVYYFSSAVSLGAPGRAISFTVPTGNFGDIFAGFVAKQMGLPIEKLVIATNQNDILARTLETGSYDVLGVTPSVSPSMDIQVSSNFERLLFEVHDRDSEAVVRMMSGLKQSGCFSIADKPMERLRQVFAAERASEAETAATIKSVLADSGYLLDPHSAVGVHVARKIRAVEKDAEMPEAPMIVLSTAHPAKFPAAVVEASGQYPALPVWLSDLLERDERLTVIDNSLEKVEAFILAHARAASDKK
ncbi:threonine synthase [Cohaesibacter celericrescens]|uniref:Threonine synthase n=1 Tax=Cohaesibacter celericrescens TaxID=2067669 RepID=A0A2N5XKL6_9HYPH|nr:threonine synthase [Cohaesibacter celericrescens]PLW74977.1 threonine synthase [Cohaesibacter celericrescens]